MEYNVLIIDDDKIICMLINSIIKKSELPNASIFQSAERALNYLVEHDKKNQNFLIFLDINMPEMNGWEFLKCLDSKNLNANVYVSIITSSINEADKNMAAQFDCVFDYLIKPVKLDDVIRFNEYDFLKPFFAKDKVSK